MQCNIDEGWSELDGGEAEISDDGVQQFPYSDHCSFLELVLGSSRMWCLRMWCFDDNGY